MVGAGWHIATRSKPPVTRVVFCDIDSLTSRHPAWKQLVQIRAMQKAKYLSKNRAVLIGSLKIDHFGVLPELIPVSEPRGAYRARMEQSVSEELARVGMQLRASVLVRLDEKRRELEVNAEVDEADARRRSEQQLAKELRVLNESYRFDRVDAEIKLNALKSQLAAEGINVDNVQRAIMEKQADLDGVLSALARDEDNLRSGIESNLAKASQDRRIGIDNEISALSRQEYRRIGDLLEAKRVRLFNDLDENGFAKLESEVHKQIVPIGLPGSDASERALSSRLSAGTEYEKAINSSSDNLSNYERSLDMRIRTELEAIVRRIARTNDLQVTFKKDDNARNKTDWFRKRLPYKAGQGVS